ncbi:MAG: MFS transporter, partial [candidate division KSB1 bacterium]|nr:MFS transporter [candidate division KSB1 bacterium]
LIGGALADRLERRRLLIGCQVAALAINGGVAALMLAEPFGAANVAVLLGLTFAAAANMAIDQPARQAATPAIVGMAALPSAITLQMVAQQVTFPLALPLVGFLNSRMEPGEVYALTLLAWAGVLPLVTSWGAPEPCALLPPGVEKSVIFAMEKLRDALQQWSE